MGSDLSNPQQVKDWTLDSSVLYETDAYELRRGVGSDGSKISVFGTKKDTKASDALERSAKFLRRLRHPCVMKHVQSYKRKQLFYLVTEEVTPLEILLANGRITAVEVVAGLHDILLALEFLHVKCGVRYNNLSTSSMFVSGDGNWKLGAFELAEEYANVAGGDAKREAIHVRDMFAFGEVVLHLLDHCNLQSQSVEKFVARIKDECMNDDVEKRSNSCAIRSDSFFRNDLLEIKSFLQNLMLKTPDQRTEFFKSLSSNLGLLEPNVLANHLIPLLLSRLVFLEPSAKQYFLPSLLTPKTETETSPDALLRPELFRQHVVPRMSRIFSVHDRHIRLLLLDHFDKFAHLFSKDELKEHVLPEVLVGIRDNNQELVAASLRALATLVNLLGTQIVIGGNNRRVFTNSSPSKHSKAKGRAIKNRTMKPSRTPDATGINVQEMPASDADPPGRSVSTEEPATLTPGIPERSSPEGRESGSEQWSDWEDDATVTTAATATESDAADSEPTVVEAQSQHDETSKDSKDLKDAGSLSSRKRSTGGLGEEYDIKALNIRAVAETEEDFFVGMEPALSEANHKSATSKKQSSLFSVLADGDVGAGWDDGELETDW